jgi:hypothetical protein
MMPNDPLSLPNNAAQSREEADDPTHGAAIPTTERERSFLTEYTSHQTDTQRLLARIARLKSATLEGSPTEAPAAFVHALADVAVVIQQIEGMLSANASAAPDVYFAVERIQDIAMALRQREVDAVLCDSLEESIREIGDATVRHDAAVSRVAGAAALLHELAQRVDEMRTRGAAPAGSPATDIDLTAPADEKPHGVAADSDADVPTTNSLNEKAGGLPEPLIPVHQALPEKQAESDAKESAPRRFEPVLLPVPSPIEERAQVQYPAETELSLSMRTDTTPALRELSDDPLAVLQALSEEELIALFS